MEFAQRSASGGGIKGERAPKWTQEQEKEFVHLANLAARETRVSPIGTDRYRRR